MIQNGNRTKNFRKILTIVKEILTYFSESDEKTWFAKYQTLWFQKLDELASLIFSDKELRDYLSKDDLRDRIYNITLYLNKNVNEITDDDLEKYLDELLKARKNYDFFFPAMELFDFPDGYKLGLCELHSFSKLPPEAQARISSDWEHMYEREKATYYVQSLEKYQEQKKKGTYFCVTVRALGHNKAIEAATGHANQALNILKCFYLLEHIPKLTACYFLANDKYGGAVEEERFKWGWYSHRINSEIEEYLQTINGFVRNQTDDEIARRCLSAIDTYGLMQSETPLELRFLLSVIGTECLLLGREDKDFLGWKLREKVAILFGDSAVWFREFLNKKTPTQDECNENRVAAKADLAKRITDLYEKRSALVHRYDEEKKLTEDDFRLASMIMRFSMQKLLRLYVKAGIRRVSKVSTVDPQSLDGFIESIKYSVPLDW